MIMKDLAKRDCDQETPQNTHVAVYTLIGVYYTL